METGQHETHLMTGREVCDLLHIDKSTLHIWRGQGRIAGFQPAGPKGHWRYRADQPLIAAALREVAR